MHEHTARPKARENGIVIEELGDELLVYDRDRDVAHCLGAVAAQVWRSCDGERDLAQIGRLVSTPPDDRDALVEDALVELQEKGLLVASSVVGNGRPKGLSRRQVVGRMASLAAAPLIVSVVAPTAQAATSPSLCAALNQTCTGASPGPGDCCTAGLSDVVCPPGGNRKCCIPVNATTCTLNNQCCGATRCDTTVANGTCVACGSGTSCTTNTDCCASNVCGTIGASTATVCCRPTGATCNTNNPCCTGLSCSGGTCVTF